VVVAAARLSALFVMDAAPELLATVMVDPAPVLNFLQLRRDAYTIRLDPCRAILYMPK
jgi:hypothetical protein